MDTIPLKPERKAQLEEYAKRHGPEPAVALDEALASYLEWERQDFAEAMEGIRQGLEDVKAGRTLPPTRSSPRCGRSMTFRVEMTARAERDAEEILEWLSSQHAGDTGIGWFLASLGEFPKRCRAAPESAIFPFDVHQLLHGHRPHVYRILFTVGGDTVYVPHIRHGSRRPIKH